MNAILIEILVALSLAAAGALGTWEHMHKKVAAAEEATKQAQDDLKAVQAALVVRETARAVTARSAASARASLGSALAAPVPHTWALGPVPKEVQDALCRTVACPASAPVGVSDGATAPAP